MRVLIVDDEPLARVRLVLAVLTGRLGRRPGTVRSRPSGDRHVRCGPDVVAGWPGVTSAPSRTPTDSTRKAEHAQSLPE